MNQIEQTRSFSRVASTLINIALTTASNAARQASTGLVSLFRLGVSIAFLAMATTVIAQSTDSDDSAAVDPQALIEQLEERLAKEKEELENVKSQRESMQTEQDKIREELEVERSAVKEQEKKLLELCEEHNTLNPDNPKDCEKELGA